MARKLIEKTCAECGSLYSTRLKTECCSKSCANRKSARDRKLTIDPDSGLTLTELYHKRSVESLRETYYGSESHKNAARQNILKMDRAEATAKATETKSKVDEDGLTLAQKSTQKAIKTKIANGMIVCAEQVEPFYKYTREVRVMTERNLKSWSVDRLEQRGRHTYHADHIYSIFDGYHNNVPPEVIANIKNIRLIPAKENLQKQSRSDISLMELYKLVNQNFNETENLAEERKVIKAAPHSLNGKSSCNVCGKITNHGNIKRWHNENCRFWSSPKVSDLTK